MSTDKIDTEKYQGSGKFTSAVGRGALEGGTGLLAGAAVSKIFGAPKAFGSAAIAVGAIAGLHGIYKGMQSSSRGHHQFDALKTEVQNKDAIIAALTAPDTRQGKGR